MASNYSNKLYKDYEKELHQNQKFMFFCLNN